ncbi:Uncharacterised protein [Bordetella pertussis]|nr:Uncharacterised protein [Bordetella pertussis]
MGTPGIRKSGRTQAAACHSARMNSTPSTPARCLRAPVTRVEELKAYAPLARTGRRCSRRRTACRRAS